MRFKLKTKAGVQRESKAKGRRSAREAFMAGGASPPRRASSVNTSFLDEIDDPHGDYGRMEKSESSSYGKRHGKNQEPD